jgi:hypothetical protein
VMSTKPSFPEIFLPIRSRLAALLALSSIPTVIQLLWRAHIADILLHRVCIVLLLSHVPRC